MANNEPLAASLANAGKWLDQPVFARTTPPDSHAKAGPLDKAINDRGVALFKISPARRGIEGDQFDGSPTVFVPPSWRGVSNAGRVFSG
jgi:hypothetical protein